MMNQARLLAQMKRMQAEMTKAQEELAETVVTGTAAGGSVEVVMSCDQRVRGVTVKPDVVDPQDVGTLEDLIVVAVNDALQKATDASQRRMASVTGGLNLPGMT